MEIVAESKHGFNWIIKKNTVVLSKKNNCSEEDEELITN